MHICLVLFLSGLVSVYATTDDVWMQLVSAQIHEAELGHIREDSKDIPALADELGLKTLVTLVGKAGLVDALKGDGPFTVFGPTDKAFANLPKPFVAFLLKNVTLLSDILEYHVIPAKAESGDLTNDELVKTLMGKPVRINIYKKEKETVITASGRQVIKADQEASNGVIHVVGGVLFPPPGTASDVVAKCPAFSLLLKGLQAAGLVDTLASAGPFTVFAPSDKAVRKIPQKCLIALFKDKAKLTKVLTYHVAPGTYYSAGLSCGDKLKTVEGSDVQVHLGRKGVYVNRATVTYPDLTVTNGVIHVIDSVLFPRDDDVNDFCADVTNEHETIEEEEDELLSRLLNSLH